MILHIVLYQPKATVTVDEASEFKAVLVEAARVIPSIRQVRIGRTVDLGMAYNAGSKDQNFEYVAVFEFESVNGLTAYMVHPAHVALAEQFWRHCDRTMILDVESEDPTAGVRPG